MAFMTIGIVLSVVSLAMQIKFFYGGASITANAASQMQNAFMQIQKRMIMFSAFLTSLFAALLSWIIMRLSSAKYRAEFVNQSNGN